MPTTPPPPARARTPPTPLHGAKHDAYEPFSPRRSGRIHTRQTMHPSPAALDSPPRHNLSSARVTAATPRQHKPSHRNSSQTFSPPPSPGSPALRRRAHTTLGRKNAKPSIFVDEPASEDELAADPLQHSRPGIMFPTPAKTPRKRPSKPDSTLASTARVLFPGRSMHPDDIVPSPRKSRKQSKKAAFSLESFAEACDNGGEKIEIYTDSKERVPEMDESEDNPFITRASARAGPARQARKSRNGMSRKIDEAVENEEGMVYVFRGKKVFRRFDADANADDDDSMDDLGEDEEVVTERDIRKTARGRKSKRFTRSTIKPRILFPAKTSTPDLEAEEEAATDIEDELAMNDAESATPSKIATPKKSYRLVTPPTTVRKNRSGAALTPDSSPLGPAADEFADELAPTGPAKRSPFDSWQRTKPHARTASGKRHAAESMEKLASPKRSRNATQS